MVNKQLRVRILLRVSSNAQLDAEGDLPTQRAIVVEYIKKNAEKNNWIFDEFDVKSEYSERAISGFKKSVDERDVLQQILKDAKNHEFDILVAYKDDRLGRRKNEIPKFIEELAIKGILVFTVKDGCITPHNDIEDLMVYLRYWKAEASSRDTSERVRDAAIQNVKAGKNVGGNAPYGYKLVPSGEISKHKRILHKKVKVPEKIKIVLLIYDLAITKGYGAFKIAKYLNSVEEYRLLAPNGYSWKSGTISSILKNPIYTGYEVYNRRIQVNNQSVKMDRENWIMSEVCKEEIKIMEISYWEEAQKIRETRKQAINERKKNNGRIPQNTAGILSLIDVVYCSHCGRKMTNGSKYNYWTTKEGEKRKSLVGYYRCQTKQSAENCFGKTLIRADELEEAAYLFIKDYLSILEDNSLVIEKIVETTKSQASLEKKRITRLKQQVKEIDRDIETLKETLPKILRNEIALSLELLNQELEKCNKKKEHVLQEMDDIERNIVELNDNQINADSFINTIPAWRDAFDNADTATKRVLVNKLISRIDVGSDDIKIQVNIDRNDFLSRITTGFGVSRQRLQFHNHIFYRL